MISIHHMQFCLSQNESYMKVLIMSFNRMSVYCVFMDETNVYLLDGTEGVILSCKFKLQRLHLKFS